MRSTTTLLFIAVAGFTAQLVDGGLGMGFGATSTTILIMLAGLTPAAASAVVHTAELGTTLVRVWRTGASATWIGARWPQSASRARSVPLPVRCCCPLYLWSTLAR